MIFKRKSSARARRPALRNEEPPQLPSTFSYAVRRRERTPKDSQQDAPQPAPGGYRLGQLSLARRFGLIILSVVVLISVVNSLSLSVNPKVLTLGSDASRLPRPLSDYQDAAAQDFKKSIWNRNKLTVNTGKVSRQLQQTFPEITKSTITIPLLSHRPVVYIQPSQPALMLVTGHGSFIVNDTGRAVLRKEAVGSSDGLPTVNDQSGLAVQTGQQALPAANVGFIRTVAAQLAAKQFSVSGMVLPPASSELDVQLAGQPYFVKFNLQSGTAREQAGTFLATITQLKRQNITPSKYVDVRVEGRAYYQ